jgi:hypothetical protein
MGLMATFTGIGTPAGDDRLLDAERGFLATARRQGLRLYPQAENIGRRLDYEAYYGRDVFDAFARLKARFDPDHVINPGVVFPSETPPPARSSLGRLAATTFARLFGEDR